ncbi:gamma-glutamyltransferase family protein [Rhodoferax sp. GW822-FHT02A01]|uniref:gamma-glutamyltransferase family protein n=1 Tax=Rhodoferax sp. GW822-FHT02A01 TaxID=3141537 RepID=UPI00315D597C
MRNFELPGRSLAAARHAMAATSHPASTLTAVEILKAGGNAMDAAVAACAVQCVVEAGSTGVGGDCFAMFSMGDATQVRAYNGSGRAPAAATLEAARAAGLQEIPQHSPWAVTVPGAVEAWCRLVADHGRMPMREVLAPAIRMAREGYTITPRVAYDLDEAQPLLRQDPSTRATFLVDGKAPTIGDMQYQPLLAITMEAIGHDGPRAFYQGDIARDMVGHLRQHGGCHTEQDFASVAGEYVEPLSYSYRGHTVYECPPNGQGVIALMILGILQRFPISGDPLAPDNLHLAIEATRLAYAARDAWLAEPTTSRVQPQYMLSDTLLDSLAAKIDLKQAITDLPPFVGPEHRDTAYIAVVDKDRNVVSFINSLFDHYGTGLMAPRSGVLFHNRGQGFSLNAAHDNVLAPRKRPMHTLIPGMVAKDGRITMAFGVMGGHYQAMGHANLLSRLIDHGMDLQAAMELPRLFPLPGTLRVETEGLLLEKVGAELSRRGFGIEASTWAIGGSQAVRIDWDKGTLQGGSDHRKDGMALGY